MAKYVIGKQYLFKNIYGRLETGTLTEILDREMYRYTKYDRNEGSDIFEHLAE